VPLVILRINLNSYQSKPRCFPCSYTWAEKAIKLMTWRKQAIGPDIISSGIAQELSSRNSENPRVRILTTAFSCVSLSSSHRKTRSHYEVEHWCWPLTMRWSTDTGPSLWGGALIPTPHYEVEHWCWPLTMRWSIDTDPSLWGGALILAPHYAVEHWHWPLTMRWSIDTDPSLWGGALVLANFWGSMFKYITDEKTRN